MKYNMIICNIRKMDDAYTEKSYTNEWKRKRNDYTIKYNVKMTSNIEMKIVNIGGKRKITKGIDT